MKLMKSKTQKRSWENDVDNELNEYARAETNPIDKHCLIVGIFMVGLSLQQNGEKIKRNQNVRMQIEDNALIEN
jgi:hypothetical protein